MASGYAVSGRGDLDSLFVARTGTARANVGFLVGGVDLAQRYEPIGSSQAIAATGYQASGSDLAQLFLGIKPLTLVVAENASTTVTRGYRRANSTGSLTPSQINGKNVYWLYDWWNTSSPSVKYFSLAIDGGGATLTQSFFLSITGNGVTNRTSSANFSAASAPIFTWDWVAGSQMGFASSGTYPMTYT